MTLSTFLQFKQRKLAKTSLRSFHLNRACVHCLTKVPQRLGAYLDVIDFCTIPRSYKEVDTLLRAGDALRASVASNSQPLQPSFFLDMLERNGGLVWKDGWIATGKGKELAKTLRAAMA